MSSLKSFIQLCGVALLVVIPLQAAAPAKAIPPAAESKAQTELKALVDRQHALLAMADKATDAASLEDLRPKFQKLVNDYEQYLGDHPTVAVG